MYRSRSQHFALRSQDPCCILLAMVAFASQHTLTILVEPLASAYGLAKHRDGRWEWAIAPGVSPSPRYQHAAVFVNARLHVSGGALGGGRMVEDSSSIAEVKDVLAASMCLGVFPTRSNVSLLPQCSRFPSSVSFSTGGNGVINLGSSFGITMEWVSGFAVFGSICTCFVVGVY
ncbi:hypothetical protein GIB67_035393 [Kingdonia uniflora]|uniref:Uncharacterized protein n=1 Tax=Kingdonia uniflora TaxID=39325 RepID=A0A7J7MMD0_9MAGN|nr:hypothetical protein GIB67_035393 [Kingdonia uniflora]